MNYLAHIYLSGDDGLLKIGNFIGDGVKGNAYNDYPAPVRRGILLHREIDDFTDHHPLVKEAVFLLKGTFGRYSAVLVDIYFDHFLAVNFKQYSGGVSLRYFAFRFYVSLVLNYRCLPSRFKHFIWHFILTDRLNRYASVTGIRQSLDIMATYKKMPVDPSAAVDFLESHYDELYILFQRFFPELQRICQVRQVEFGKNVNNMN